MTAQLLLMLVQTCCVLVQIPSSSAASLTLVNDLGGSLVTDSATVSRRIVDHLLLDRDGLGSALACRVSSSERLVLDGAEVLDG